MKCLCCGKWSHIRDCALADTQGGPLLYYCSPCFTGNDSDVYDLPYDNSDKHEDKKDKKDEDKKGGRKKTKEVSKKTAKTTQRGSKKAKT